MKQRVAEMEKEAIKLRELQAAAAIESNTADGEDTNMETEEDKTIADSRSVYVGNVSHIHISRRSSTNYFHILQSFRWTIVLRLKKSKDTFRLAEQSTE